MLLDSHKIVKIHVAMCGTGTVPVDNSPELKPTELFKGI
jgi:hypothetical protein